MELVSIRGRGADHNPGNRFEPIHFEPDDEYMLVDPDEDPIPFKETQVFHDHTKQIIASNNSPDVGFDFSINPYRGCEHGCSYCFARPFHEYLGFSAGLDFETKLMVKTSAAALLREELGSRSWVPQPIALSGVTDCYQPIERKFRITRACLEVMLECRNPVTVITKNSLVTRDIDILGELAARNLVFVHLSITSLDRKLQRVMEPRASTPENRLKAVEALSKAGIPVGVMIAPIVPGLTDSEVPQIMKAVADAGARSVGYVMLRLPHGVKEIFARWLEQHFPDRADKVMNFVRGMRDGDLYNSKWFERQRGEGQYAEQVDQLFEVNKKRFGLDRGMPELSTSEFRRPARGGQLTLF